MALKLGMVRSTDVKNSVAALIHDINELHDGHHACGIHGLRHLYSILADHGHDDLAFKLLTDQTFPSPGYVMSCGLSTWPERRWEWKKQRYRNSFNHPMNGGFVAFMHESIGGIRPDPKSPGYKHFQLKPHLTQQLDWAKASVDSPYGLIRSEWKNAAEAFEWEVEIPPNTSATVYVPNPSRGKLTVDGDPYAGQTAFITLGQQLWLKCELGSGVYRLAVE